MNLRAGIVAVVAVAAALAACREAAPIDREPVPGVAGASKATSAVRAARRAYDGAPPIIPHRSLGAPCLECHATGMVVPSMGAAPPSPHSDTVGMSAARCEQCHLYQRVRGSFRPTRFVGLAPGGAGERARPGAPPVMPHRRFGHERCLACHDGAAAREEIRCPHPERVRCRQCHLEVVGAGQFAPPVASR